MAKREIHAGAAAWKRVKGRTTVAQQSRVKDFLILVIYRNGSVRRRWRSVRSDRHGGPPASGRAFTGADSETRTAIQGTPICCR